MHAPASIFLNQREKGHFPLPDLIRAQAPSSDGYFCPASISAVHQRTVQEMVPLDIITQAPETPADQLRAGESPPSIQAGLTTCIPLKHPEN